MSGQFKNLTNSGSLKLSNVSNQGSLSIQQNTSPTGSGVTHIYNVEVGNPWNAYHDPGATYLQVGPSQEGGGTVPIQAGWYFIDDNSQVRQLTDGHLWFYPGPGPAPNGTGWLAVVDQDWVYSDSNLTITFYETHP